MKAFAEAEDRVDFGRGGREGEGVSRRQQSIKGEI